MHIQSSRLVQSTRTTGGLSRRRCARHRPREKLGMSPEFLPIVSSMKVTARVSGCCEKSDKIRAFFSFGGVGLLQQDRFIWTLLTFNTCQGLLALPVASPRLSSVFSCLLCVFLFVVCRLSCLTWPAGSFPPFQRIIYPHVDGVVWIRNGRVKTLHRPRVEFAMETQEKRFDDKVLAGSLRRFRIQSWSFNSSQMS